VNEKKLATADATTHAKFHVDRGQMMLSQSFLLESEREFREAISLDAGLPAAHSGLAMALATMAMTTPSASLVNAARAEANASLRLQPNVEAYLVLAKLELRENKQGPASDWLAKALALDPKSEAALALKRTVDARAGLPH